MEKFRQISTNPELSDFQIIRINPLPVNEIIIVEIYFFKNTDYHLC